MLKSINTNSITSISEDAEVFLKKFPSFYDIYSKYHKSFNGFVYSGDKKRDTLPLTPLESISFFQNGDVYFDCSPLFFDLHEAIKYIFDSEVFLQINYPPNKCSGNLSALVKRVIVTNGDLYNKLKKEIELNFDISVLQFYNKNSIGDSAISCCVGDMVKFKDSNGIRSYDLGMVIAVDESNISVVFKNGKKINFNKKDPISIGQIIKV
jgi:hypothetical protein